MALTHTIKSFTEDGSGNVDVGFQVQDDKGDIFYIDKIITKGSKTDEAIVEEGYNAAKAEIDAWVASNNNIGKTWDPSSKSLS